MKLIVTDLDGTLLSDEKKVSEYNIEILNRAVKEKEIELVVASGRDIYSIKNLTKDLKIKYYICFNGAKIYNDDKLIYKEAIDEKICEDILKKGMELNLKFSATSENEIHYTKMDNEYTRLENGKDKLKFFYLKSKEDIKQRNFEKIVFVGIEEELIHLRNYIEEKYGDKANIFYSGSGVLDIVNNKCSKGTAVGKIATLLNIDKSKIIAFGDNENDVSMLELVGHPVIMENSRKDLKKKKYNKTVSNNNDGVGKYINDNILNE